MLFNIVRGKLLIIFFVGSDKAECTEQCLTFYRDRATSHSGPSSIYVAGMRWESGRGGDALGKRGAAEMLPAEPLDL